MKRPHVPMRHFATVPRNFAAQTVSSLKLIQPAMLSNASTPQFNLPIKLAIQPSNQAPCSNSGFLSALFFYPGAGQHLQSQLQHSALCQAEPLGSNRSHSHRHQSLLQDRPLQLLIPNTAYTSPPFASATGSLSVQQHQLCHRALHPWLPPSCTKQNATPSTPTMSMQGPGQQVAPVREL